METLKKERRKMQNEKSVLRLLISPESHRRLKTLAAMSGKTMSNLGEEIIDAAYNEHVAKELKSNG